MTRPSTLANIAPAINATERINFPIANAALKAESSAGTIANIPFTKNITAAAIRTKAPVRTIKAFVPIQRAVRIGPRNGNKAAILDIITTPSNTAPAITDTASSNPPIANAVLAASPADIPVKYRMPLVIRMIAAAIATSAVVRAIIITAPFNNNFINFLASANLKSLSFFTPALIAAPILLIKPTGLFITPPPPPPIALDAPPPPKPCPTLLTAPPASAAPPPPPPNTFLPIPPTIFPPTPPTAFPPTDNCAKIEPRYSTIIPVCPKIPNIPVTRGPVRPRILSFILFVVCSILVIGSKLLAESTPNFCCSAFISDNNSRTFPTSPPEIASCIAEVKSFPPASFNLSAVSDAIFWNFCNGPIPLRPNSSINSGPSCFVALLIASGSELAFLPASSTAVKNENPAFIWVSAILFSNLILSSVVKLAFFISPVNLFIRSP